MGPKGPHVGPRRPPEPPWGPDPGLCAKVCGRRAPGAGRAGAGRFAKNLWPLPPHPHPPNPLFNIDNYLSTPLKIKIDVPNVEAPCVSQLFVNFGP